MTTFITNQQLIGVDLNNSAPTTSMFTNSAGSAIPAFDLMTKVLGSNDTEWLFVQASGAVSAGDCVQINASGTATRATAAGVATETNTVAFAQNAFADTDFGWVTVKGKNLTIAVSATAADNTQLYVATTSGKLSTTASSGTLIGIQIANVSSTATTTTTTGSLTYPKCITPGF
jgi:hypothetical protein